MNRLLIKDSDYVSIDIVDIFFFSLESFRLLFISLLMGFFINWCWPLCTHIYVHNFLYQLLLLLPFPLLFLFLFLLDENRFTFPFIATLVKIHNYECEIFMVCYFTKALYFPLLSFLVYSRQIKYIKGSFPIHKF